MVGLSEPICALEGTRETESPGTEIHIAGSRVEDWALCVRAVCQLR